eukprot:814882-Amphidinium_carterae.1
MRAVKISGRSPDARCKPFFGLLLQTGLQDARSKVSEMLLTICFPNAGALVCGRTPVVSCGVMLMH